MMWILLLSSLISSVCGTYVMKTSPTFYQTEENGNVTHRWDSQNKTDLSLSYLVCFLSEPPKVLYQMINGVEVPESQHQQFAGRVRLDRDALREGQIRLHLSKVTAEDSGNYTCLLAARYDDPSMSWVVLTSDFVVNVCRASDVSFKTPGTTKGSKPPRGNQYKEYFLLAVFIGALAATVLAALGKLLYQTR